MCDEINVEDSLPDVGQANIASSSNISNSFKQSSNGKNTLFTKTEKSCNLAYLTETPSKIEEEEEAEDEDYTPSTEGWKNVIRVGFAYQVFKKNVKLRKFLTNNFLKIW